jgi:hypothetical protein
MGGVAAKLRRSPKRLSSSPPGATYATVARETDNLESESMSDVAEKAAARAIRGLFGALGFIFIVLGLGLEATTDKPDIQFALGLFLFVWRSVILREVAVFGLGSASLFCSL